MNIRVAHFWVTIHQESYKNRQCIIVQYQSKHTHVEIPWYSENRLCAIKISSAGVIEADAYRHVELL